MVACVKSASAEPVLIRTQFFVWTVAGALDPEGPENIKSVVKQHNIDDIIVMAGALDADIVDLYAEAVVYGDPSWAWSLARVAL